MPLLPLPTLRRRLHRLLLSGFLGIAPATGIALDPGPPPPMQEIATVLRSTVLQNERPIWIRPPRDPASARHLVVFLDGELYRDRIQTPALLDTLSGTLPDAWYVFVSYQSEESRWRECPCHAPFATFIVSELLPWLEQQHPAIRQAEQRTLIGLSYTGLAAAFIAHEYPGVFQKVICQSGSFWWHDGALVEQYRRQPLRQPTAFYLEVGSRETQTHVQHRPDVLQTISQIGGVQRFRDELLRQGQTVHYSEFDGAHEFKAWQKTLPAALNWALAHP